MRNISDYLNTLLCEGKDMEALVEKVDKLEQEAKEDANVVEKEANKAEESIKSEKDFRDYAKNKFEEVFGDDLDEDKMKDVVDGILKKYADDAENGDWGILVGVLNKSFGE